MNKAVKIAVGAGIVASPLLSAVYVAPADIDAYKKKTDQSFYDLYQNPDSAIAKGINPALKNYVNNVKTNNKIATGDTISKVVIGVVQGDAIKQGTKSSIYIPGLGTYLLSVDDTGKVTINGRYASDGKAVIREGKNAIQLSSPVCAKSTTHYIGKFAPKSCDAYRRIAKEINFNVITGQLVQRIVEQQTPSRCVLHTGKYSAYYSCSPQDRWSDTQVKAENNSVINISDLLKGKQEAIAEIRNQVKSFGRGTVEPVKYVGKIAYANMEYSSRHSHKHSVMNSIYQNGDK